MGVAWLFPGQGSQTVGMGRDLADRYPRAARVFEEANDALGIDLRALCFDGPKEDLERTANTQPALLATAIASLRAAEEAADGLAEPKVVMGHSLGEFTGLVAAGALTLADALRLVRTRGELMQAASPSRPGAPAPAAGAMAAVIGLDAYAVARALVGTPVVVANDNAPGQVVISGPRIDLARAADVLKDAGAKRIVPLRVSAAFHSPAMRAVAPRLRQAIDVTTLSALRYPVVANVDAAIHRHAREMPALLEKQVWSPVQWVASVRRAAGESVSVFVEFGPGNVLTGLVKRIVPDAATANVSDETTMRQALPLIAGGER
ncbi:MAG TPA: ACP S-malonyltransferase [Candidatus Limnocylindria bacterium]|jgi:[acyl-carrier-protein] S-malonyltransferase|nr:ACP S-malonyltransferase [Candidatus Limnocylindria bacterium]